MPYEPWQPGMVITANRLASISPTWQTWTPSWSTTTGLRLPSLGNATLSCDFCQTGNLVVCSFDIGFGTTTNFGASPTSADNWLFGLPVASAAASGDTLGYCSLRMSDAATLIGRVQANTNSTFRISVDSGRVDAVAVTAAGLVDSVSPWTWASGHALHGSFQYQAA
ncbi:hypothetical protein [Streptomyces sp. NPDC002520]